MTAAVEAVDDLAPRIWTYLGRRWANGKLWFAFLDHRNELVHYGKGPAGAVVGGLYEVEAAADSRTARTKSARWTGRSDADQVAEWRLADRAATAAQEAERARKRAAADNGDFGSLTLAEVRRLIERQPAHVATSTVAAVLGYLRGTRHAGLDGLR